MKWPTPSSGSGFRRTTDRLLKMESYSLTKRLMRTALFPNYVKIGDAIIPRVMVFVDELVQGSRTQITLTEISLNDLPDSVFTKAFIECKPLTWERWRVRRRRVTWRTLVRQ